MAKRAERAIKLSSLAFVVGLLAMLAVVLAGCVVVPAKATVTRSGEVQPASAGFSSPWNCVVSWLRS